jgi:proteasome lid subunit RPN8/RPN11
MFDLFSISKRHYDIIIGQATKNFPQESGGFLGGNSEGLVQAILPMFNMFLYDKTSTFVVNSEDLARAHSFFSKHNLQYYGLYHTHPHGVAIPSKQDIDTKQNYHFIVGFKNKDKDLPFLNVFKVVDRKGIQIKLRIVSDKNFQPIDIHAKAEQNKKDINKTKTMYEEAADLSGLIDDIKHSNPHYPKQPPLPGQHSDFSTSA